MPRNWYQNAVFYGMDIRRFQDSNGDGFGDIPGLISRLDYLADLGVNGLWVLPFYETPFRDNGYDVQDYFSIDPRVGTLDDFVELIRQAHEREIRLVVDLVMNHSSDQHPWFQASRRSLTSRFRSYYVWVDEPPEESVGGDPIFPGEEDSLWAYDPVAKAYYYHRFYHFQPELLVANPDVQEEIFKVVDFWLSLGVDGFRFDAAPIMLDPKGLKSAKMEDPHKLFRELHRAITQRRPDAALLGEANVQMDLMDEFFGGGSEMNLLFNFLLGPHILLALARGNAVPAATYLHNLLDAPETDEWLNFLRNLDELSLEIMPPEQTQAIYDSFGPEPEMQIYNRGIRRRIAPMLADHFPGHKREALELAYSLCFSVPGVPLIMYGDEIGMGEDLSLPGRNSVRTPMQWANEPNAGFSSAEQLVAPVIRDGHYGYPMVNVADQQREDGSFYHFLKQLIKVWRDCPELGLCTAEVLEIEGNEERAMAHCLGPAEDGQKALVLLHNFTTEVVSVSIPYRRGWTRDPQILFGRGELLESTPDAFRARLPGLGYLWLRV